MPLRVTPNFTHVTDIFQLRFLPVAGLSYPQLHQQPGNVEVRLPEDLYLDTLAQQEWADRLLLKTLRQQAKLVITPRLERLAAQFGYTYKSVTYKKMSSRWGSCSSDGRLNLSIWLLLAPSKLLDYVLVHELAHLRHLNHQPEFWQEVDRMLGTPGAGKVLAHELSAFGRTLPDIGWVAEVSVTSRRA